MPRHTDTASIRVRIRVPPSSLLFQVLGDVREEDRPQRVVALAIAGLAAGQQEDAGQDRLLAAMQEIRQQLAGLQAAGVTVGAGRAGQAGEGEGPGEPEDEAALDSLDKFWE